jgi:hypothetical protein
MDSETRHLLTDVMAVNPGAFTIIRALMALSTWHQLLHHCQDQGLVGSARHPVMVSMPSGGGLPPIPVKGATPSERCDATFCRGHLKPSWLSRVAVTWRFLHGVV